VEERYMKTLLSLPQLLLLQAAAHRARTLQTLLLPSVLLMLTASLLL
jgi:hypothetical protein